MEVITAHNVNDAYVLGMELLRKYGVKQESRAGTVLVTPFPVTTHYQLPEQRVLFDAKRDANPFFHLMESLWMLAGRNDATWLDHFVKDFSSRFAEDGGRQHGAYGFRWRKAFLDINSVEQMDQLSIVIDKLKKNHDDRRVVLQMWDVEQDLLADVKDVPCNLCVVPRVQAGHLDITVMCRSNDIIWGCYGANAVHFSVLQEYLAARIGVKIGTYYQISNNFHAYMGEFTKRWEDHRDPNDKVKYLVPVPYSDGVAASHRINVTPIVTVPDEFDRDLERFFSVTDEISNTTEPGKLDYFDFHNEFFHKIAIPMFLSYKLYRLKMNELAARVISEKMPANSDWRVACLQWYGRRLGFDLGR